MYLLVNSVGTRLSYRSTWCSANGPTQGSANHSPCKALIESRSQVKNSARLINDPINIHMNSHPNMEASNPRRTMTITTAQKKTV